MILFFISLACVFVSSYFISSLVAKKNTLSGLIYFLLTAFAQIVLAFEILSIFNSISVVGVLGLNLLMLAVSGYFWQKNGRPLYTVSLSDFFRKFWHSIKLDKSLAVLFVGWCMFIFVSLFLMILIPVVNADAGSYHVLRSTFWILNRSFEHFTIADSRNLLLPINSEILYAWVILFTKKLVFLGSFAFTGYILSIVALYGTLKFLHFSMRVRLWVIFILSSFAGVVVQSSGSETDIIIAGLVFSSLYLFWSGLKTNEKMPVFFSALAYALALGTKSTAFMAVPGVGLAMIALGIYYKKKDFYKPFFLFFGFGILNFLIFSFYNYLLNFINYGNFIATASFLQAHQNYQGLRAIPSNFIKYVFLFFDFTGFRWAEYVGDKILDIRNSLLAFMNLSDIVDGVCNPDNKGLNQTLLEPLMGLGILGFIVYLPCWLWAMVKPIFVRNKQVFFVAAFAFLLVINLAVMSYQLQFMIYSVRFMMSFCVLSAPILVWSYSKRKSFGKFIIVCFAMFYFTLVSTHLWARPYFRIVKYFKAGATLSQVREVASCSVFMRQVEENPGIITKFAIKDGACVSRDYFKKLGKNNKILYFPNSAEDLLQLNFLNIHGYDISYGLMEDFGSVDFDDYNVLITNSDAQSSNNIKHFDDRKNDAYRSPISGIVYYRKNEDNPCFYFGNEFSSAVDVNDVGAVPSLVKCEFKKAFYEKRNYVLIDTFRIMKPENKIKTDSGEDSYWTYYVYENKNNPKK